MKKNFSFFSGGIQSTIPEDTFTLFQTYELLKSDKYKNQIEVIRQTSDKKQQSKLKSQLDYVTFSGVFSKRNAESLIEYSYLVCLDFDNIPNISSFSQEIYQDSHVILGFISPSGNGLKIIVQVDKATHELAWLQVSNYFKNKYTLEADKSGKDICRACFLSHDSNAYFNPNALIFSVKELNKYSSSKSTDAELARAKRVTERILAQRIDITEQYNHWLNLGFSLATFGEDGRELFHGISQFHGEYDAKKTDEKFDNCLKTTRFDNPAYFFNRAKECGIRITKNNIVDSEKEIENNTEIHRNQFVIYNLQDYTIEIDSKRGKNTIAEGFLLYIKYQTTDENEQHTWILELRLPDRKPFYVEVSHDDFFEPKSLEKILGAKRLNIAINYQQLQKLRGFLFNCTQFANATKILRYGLHPETELYFFANCAVCKQGKIYYPDSFGIINYKGIYLSVPQVNRGQSSPFTYQETGVLFNEWYLLFSKAQREEITFLATSFLLFSIFRDIGISVNGFSPMLYIFGIAGTAKSTLFIHLNYVFGVDGKSMGINLKGRNTEPAFVAKIEQRYNGFQFGDEYKPNHPLTPLFQASYDNKAYSKMNMASTSYLDTTDLVPKCTIGFASNFLPDLPSDEPFFSRLVVLINNNRNRTEEQKKAYRELVQMQENGITNILREIWQHRDLVKSEFKQSYHLLKTSMEKHFQRYNIGNPRYIYNMAQLLTVPFILSKHGKIALCEASNETDLLQEFLQRSESSILTSDRLVQEKSSLREFFDCMQELFDRGFIYETVHYRFDGTDIVINLQKLYQKFVMEFRKINRSEATPPSIQALQDEIMTLVGLDSQNEESRNVFFRKLRFSNEIERDKTDFIRNSFKINYLLLQENFGIDFSTRLYNSKNEH